MDNIYNKKILLFFAKVSIIENIEEHFNWYKYYSKISQKMRYKRIWKKKL